MRSARGTRNLLLAASCVLAPGPATAQDEIREIGDRGATSLPADARFAILTGGYKTTPNVLRLDKVTGRTWLCDERLVSWQPVPIEGLVYLSASGPVRFQLVVHDRTWFLLDAASGRTWRWGRDTRQPGDQWSDLAAPVGATVDGWHLIGD